jgi:hypothetical protein
MLFWLLYENIVHCFNKSSLPGEQYRLVFYITDTRPCLHNIFIRLFCLYNVLQIHILGYSLAYICLCDTFTSTLYIYSMLQILGYSLAYICLSDTFTSIFILLQILGYCLAYICLSDTFTSIFIICYRYWAIVLPTFVCMTLLPVYLFYVIDTGLFSCLHLSVWHFYQYIYSML